MMNLIPQIRFTVVIRALIVHAALLALFSLAPAAAADDDERLVSDLIDWIRSNGGVVDARQVVRRERPNHPSSPGPRGVFAAEDIPKGTMLASIPWELIVKPEEPKEGEGAGASGGADADADDAKFCPTVLTLARELASGGAEDPSPRAPYLALLRSPGAAPSVPETWSAEGRALFDEVLGENVPPRDYVRYRRWWRDECGGDPDDDAADRALFLMVTRATEVNVDGVPSPTSRSVLVPFADMYNHRNGRYHNTRIEAKIGKDFRVLAGRNIKKGEQIHYSYGDGTAEMMRDYGFIETLPQRWRFDFGDDKVAEFELDAGRDGDLRPKWIVRPDGQTVHLMEKEMERLMALESDLFHQSRKKSKEGGLPKAELDVIWKYHGSLMNAFDHSIIEARGRKANVEL